MFTGIVQGTRQVSEVKHHSGICRLTIHLEDLSDQIRRGASVSVNGVCLTVVDIRQKHVDFDVIQETLSRTGLGTLQNGDRVNIERACHYGDEVGGHQVTGHIDTVGTIHHIIHTPNNREVFIAMGTQWQKFLIPKGWISIDGISLTVVQVEADRFSVCLIPETLERTTLGFKKEGDSVNLEFDHTTKVIVQTLERILPQYLSGATS
ncbi:MAG: riboflavin synthase subunit alpha [SAR324 cluster bacterium]|nr:riboflavin synthase subunit alpha [SAR324 cluster bacterium]